MQANNAAYTPSPKTITVLVVRNDETGEINAETCQPHLVGPFKTILRTEVATVISRGNLTSRGTERWHGVRLADGTTHSVLTEGS